MRDTLISERESLSFQALIDALCEAEARREAESYRRTLADFTGLVAPEWFALGEACAGPRARKSA